MLAELFWLVISVPHFVATKTSARFTRSLPVPSDVRPDFLLISIAFGAVK